jgi:DNA mismatch repair protein MutS2
VQSLRATGEVLDVEEDEAEVRVGALRVRVPLRELERRAAPPPPAETTVRYRSPTVPLRLDLRGQTVEEALEQLDRHLDAAALAGLPWVHVVHGKGTGALRHAVRDYLRRHPLVRSYRPGEDGEGGDGVTIVTLKEEE